MSDTTIPRLPSRKVLEWIGYITGPGALLVFGIVLCVYDAKENLFTFAAWGSLDLLIAVSMWKAQARGAILPLAYASIAFFVVAMIFRNGEWQWTLVETICLVGTVIAVACWLRLGATAAVVAFNAATAIASIPIIVGNFYDPQPWEWWMWLGAVVSATIGLHLSRPWTIENIADWSFVTVSAVVCSTILLLLARPFI